MSESADERARLKEALRRHGVAGVEDFGRFVNNTEHFAPSEFDERAAMPVLLDALPGLTDIRVVDSVARHLGRKWASPEAFWPLHGSFIQWSHPTDLRAWAIGDSLATVSTIDHIEPVLALVDDKEHGRNREMLVYGLYRFKSDPRVEPALRTLISDPDVSLHAGSALQRVIGQEALAPLLEEVIRNHSGSPQATHAAKRLKSIRKKFPSS